MSPLARATTLFLAIPALALSLTAQKDRVTLVDGTEFAEASVRSFTLRKLEFRIGGRADQRDSDRVAELDVARVREAYLRAYADANSATGPDTFYTTAEGIDDAFLKQFGYYEAARIAGSRGEWPKAFQALDALEKNCPDSGFIPAAYRMRIEHYLSRGSAGAGSAEKVAKRYEQNALTKGYPAGCQLDAKYYLIRIQAVAGSIDAARMESQMNSLANSAGSTPYVGDRARLAVADAKRAQGSRDDARSIYEDLLEKEKSSASVRAGAWLGIGYCQFEGAESGDKAAYRQALLSFLRVYLETPDASPALTAEALYMGSQSARRWGGEDSGRYAAILRSRLVRNYPESPWASK